MRRTFSIFLAILFLAAAVSSGASALSDIPGDSYDAAGIAHLPSALPADCEGKGCEPKNAADPCCPATPIGCFFVLDYIDNEAIGFTAAATASPRMVEYTPLSGLAFPAETPPPRS